MKSEGLQVKVYGYRWVVLLFFVLITLMIAIQWLTFAPIAREAKIFYNVSALQIDLLSMIFMGVFLIACIPASYVIDTHGIRLGVGIGAVLTGLFGLMKGIYASSYTMMIISQVGLAVAQPFIINAATKVAVRWFPIDERATAVGIATLAQFLGFIIVMIVTPLLLVKDIFGFYDLSWMLMVYGTISVIAAILFLVFVREHPPTPAGADGYDDRFLFIEGLKHIFKQKDMMLVLLLFFIGLGMFNSISTVIDQICELKGLTIEQTGLVGGMMLIGGVAGAVILPILSDKYRKRKPFLIMGMILMTPGLVGLTFFSNYSLVLISSLVFGFFLLGAGAPIGFQYAAEVCHPAPESSSQGLLLLVGQASGILFIVGMNLINVTLFMVLFIAMALLNIFITTKLKESPMILTGS